MPTNHRGEPVGDNHANKQAEPEASQYSSMSISDIASAIHQDYRASGKSVHPYAKPYVDAMRQMNHIDDPYGADTGPSIVSYALSNLSTWRGPQARLIKAELNSRLKSSNAKGHY